ncbi:P-loop NTPase family protein [Natronorubrum daqingense]|nr:hypothetical protein [Natronorubrum daqingense]APX98334.1 hypothetical protein BB347_16620 [Natronorubrum daqingense]
MAVDSGESVVVCPECGHEQSIRQEPLLIVSGAGGTGKSAVLHELRGTRDDAVLLDSDVVWRDEFWDEIDWYVQTWLRLCRDIAQSKRPPVLFGAGLGVPASIEAHPQHECFSEIHYLVLVCDEDEQERRLRARPSGRHPGEFAMDQSDIDAQVEFNQWFKNTADDEDFTVIETTDATVEETTAQVDEWISSHVSNKTL